LFYEERNTKGWGQRFHRRKKDSATFAEDTSKLHIERKWILLAAFPTQKIRTHPCNLASSSPGLEGICQPFHES
jgi:hypothetical protein